MRINKQKTYAQNFLAKAHLAATLVHESSVSLHDIVYEIGPGKGRLTIELAKQAKKVVAIEKDHRLYVALKDKFLIYHNVFLYNDDFLNFKINEPAYKIFANVPFNKTSAMMRQIVSSENPPIESYLILQREAAEKFTGTRKTTQFSILTKPRFKMKIIRSFKRTDFCPMPKVDVVMLYIKKRDYSLISPTDKSIYERFVKYGFTAWKKHLKLTYKRIYSHNQWKRLAHDLQFPVHAKPSELSFYQWLGLFEFYRKHTDQPSAGHT
jgi:23S rRNA (adenine-N6)-dimethyltransferase